MGHKMGMQRGTAGEQMVSFHQPGIVVINTHLKINVVNICWVKLKRRYV